MMLNIVKRGGVEVFTGKIAKLAKTNSQYTTNNFIHNIL